MKRGPAELCLHVGTMKSGTTYLQRVLGAAADRLAGHGWNYPPPRPPAGASGNHEAAFYGLVGPRIPWITPEKEQRLRPAWHALAGGLRAARGSVLLSAESLAALDGDGIRHLVDHLPLRPARVVITCRDLGRVIPSSWQQHVRNGRTDSFLEYVHAIVAAAAGEDGGVVGERFWRSYRLGALVRRWADVVGIERVVIATVPRAAAPEVLWRRFAEACGMPQALVAGAVPHFDDSLAHRSVGWALAVVLQAIGSRALAAGDDVAAVRRRLACIARHAVESGWSGTPIRLPGESLHRVREWARHDVAEMLATGVRIVGDRDDLLVPADEIGGLPPDDDEIERAWALARRADPHV